MEGSCRAEGGQRRHDLSAHGVLWLNDGTNIEFQFCLK
jgi:hypothetical protein